MHKSHAAYSRQMGYTGHICYAAYPRQNGLSPNEAVERSRLQKEIWEDEGVIVGRSLDMFISKLRKKLEFDPNIKIVVIRGKGYKLEISS